MNQYDEECIATFLEKQSQLFDEPVAQTKEEAEVFLEDCMAVVCNSLEEVMEYMEENTGDVSGMTLEELSEAAEVFEMESRRFLVVEG